MARIQLICYCVYESDMFKLPCSHTEGSKFEVHNSAAKYSQFGSRNDTIGGLCALR
jgi:hypothetical protein